MLSKEERLKAANSAGETLMKSFAQQPLVMLCEVDQAGRSVGHGSGTLVTANSGRATILTAAHCVDGEPKLNALHFKAGVLADVVRSVRRAPGLDIALLELNAGALALESYAITTELIAGPDCFPITKEDALLVTGFPKQFSFSEPDLANGLMYEHFGDIAYFTHAVGSDHRALSIYWELAEVKTDAAGAFSRLGISTADPFNLKKPSGISGGAVWKYRDVDLSSIWTPAKGTKLVAVPHEFANRRQLAVPATLWRDWLLRELGTM